MTPQEAAEQYAKILKSQFMIIDGSSEFSSSDGENVSSNIKSNLERAMEYNYHAVSIVDAFTSGVKWQSEQDNQAISSALKEIEDMKDVIKLRHSTQLVTLDQLNDALKYIAELHAKVKELQDDINHNCNESLRIIRERDDLNSKVSSLEKLISSESVWTLLRYGYKSPSSSGVDDCEDDDYIDLYKISTDLKQSNRLSPESQPKPDSANLPPESAP